MSYKIGTTETDNASEAKKNQNNEVCKLGKAIRPYELEIAIMNCLGPRDSAAIKLMFFLTGNADDGTFRVAEKTVCERCNISEKSYKDARKKLVNMGWIEHTDKSIIVMYDKIYKDYQLKGG